MGHTCRVLSKVDVSNHSREAPSFRVPFCFSLPHHENKIRKRLFLSTLSSPNRGTEKLLVAGLRCMRTRLGPHGPPLSSSNISSIRLPGPGYQILKKELGGGRGASSFSAPRCSLYRWQNGTLVFCKGPRAI